MARTEGDPSGKHKSAGSQVTLINRMPRSRGDASETISSTTGKQSGYCSRVPSFSSIIAGNEGPMHSSAAHSTNTYYKSDKIGIRRFAKACTRNLVSWNDSVTTAVDFEASKSLDLGDHKRTGSESKTGTLNPPHFDQKKNNIKDRLIRSLRDTSYSSTSGNGPARLLGGPVLSRNGNTARETSNPYDFELVAKSSAKEPPLTPVRTLRASTCNVKRSENILNSSQTVSVDEPAWPNRVVLLSHLPKSTGAKTVLAAVCGGPLERIEMHGTSTAELYFLKSGDAGNFMEYGSGGMFVINGANVQPSWQEKSIGIHQPVSMEIDHEMVVNGARRCLILKKLQTAPRSRSSLSASGNSRYHVTASHSTPNQNTKGTLISEFSVDEALRDFSKYGTIVDISPVISRKLCFALHFADVRSAIAAKQEMELSDSSIGGKYKDWSVWYGKDPTDVPVYKV